MEKYNDRIVFEYTVDYVNKFAEGLSTDTISWQMLDAANAKNAPLISEQSWTLQAATALKEEYKATFGDFVEIIEVEDNAVIPSENQAEPKNKKLCISQANLLALIEKIQRESCEYIVETLTKEMPTAKIEAKLNTRGCVLNPHLEGFMWPPVPDRGHLRRPGPPPAVYGYAPEKSAGQLVKTYGAGLPAVGIKCTKENINLPSALIENDLIIVSKADAHKVALNFENIAAVCKFHREHIQAEVLRKTLMENTIVMNQYFREHFSDRMSSYLQNEVLTWTASASTLNSTNFEVEEKLTHVRKSMYVAKQS